MCEVRRKNMKKKKLYQILPFFMMGICVAGLCLVGTRIFAKKVLVGKLGIENYVTCMLADYNWGDRLERRLPENIDESQLPERLLELETVLLEAPQESTAESATQEDAGTLAKIKNKVVSVEDDIEKYCNDKFFFYSQMRSISRNFDDILNWNLAYARVDGTTFTLKTGFDYQAVEKADVTDYADTLILEQNLAKAADVDFLYVQFPYRVDEDESQVPWGAVAEENANADEVLSMLTDADVDFLDLRKELPKKGWNYNDGFYMTDGHWTTRSGFLSAGIVADYLNENYGFAYDQFYFDENNYNVKKHSVNSYAVKEQVELFLPDFTTNLTVLDAYRKEAYEGIFTETCLDIAKAQTKEYSSVLTAYSASRIRNSYLFEYQNHMETKNQKRILVSSDSFSWHLLPYLALDTEYIDYVYKMTPEQMEYYIDTLQPDMVIILDRVQAD